MSTVFRKCKKCGNRLRKIIDRSKAQDRYFCDNKACPAYIWQDMAVTQYPEHVKLGAVKETSQEIGEFIEWLQTEKKLCLASFLGDVLCGGAHASLEELLAEYFDIDLVKLEEEKSAMLALERKVKARA